MTIIQSIELMVAGVFFVFGLSYLVQTKVWSEWFKRFSRRPKVTAIIAGMAHFLGGMFVLSFHWVWQGTQIIVTITGVLMALEGIIYLLYPQCIGLMLRNFNSRILSIVRVSGITLVVLSAVIFYDLLLQPGFWQDLSQPSVWGHWQGPFGG